MNYIQSILTTGTAGSIVQIECQLSNGLPSIIIVGLGNKAIDEAKERIRSAFASTGIVLPKKRITINLAPADLRKESSSLDLGIAAAIMIASGQLAKQLEDQIIIGEIGLNGDVRPVRGIIGQLLAGRKLGVKQFIVPAANLKQSLLVPGVEIIPVGNVRELQQETPTNYIGGECAQLDQLPSKDALSEVSGQAQAKRALMIAAAGGHNILLSGPPGTGKSMLAKALPSILPPLSHQEILEVTHLHSLASNTYDALVTTRPFRAPHHSSSHASMVGGGPNARPGEITLSHRGILFLDEIPEFGRFTLEALRQPLEDKHITIARSRQTVEYPADFILVATANPCPCGFYGTSTLCECSPGQIQRYRQKLSGPILDRIDIHVTVNTVEHDTLLLERAHEEDEPIRQKITHARNMQSKRYDSEEKVNATMSNQDIRRSSLLTPESKSLLDAAATQLNVSARSYMRLVKVARTIADLESSETIEPHHVSEALQYRTTRL